MTIFVNNNIDSNTYITISYIKNDVRDLTDCKKFLQSNFESGVIRPNGSIYVILTEDELSKENLMIDKISDILISVFGKHRQCWITKSDGVGNVLNNKYLY